MSNRFRLSTDVLLLVIGALLLVLLTAALAKYSTSWQGLQESDWLGAYGFFIVVGFPVVIFGLALIARYIVSGT
jgi:hypothetical protein